ncbi:MAG: DNA recombination protein RmuC [Proteobacteria bacterium]|nr:DNA recombination protein RmuC [Pseudomonadota bacterium]
MDPTLILAIAVALAVGALVAVLLLRGRGAGAMAEIAGRLTQMAESQAATQAQLAERLQAQERALAKAVEERLVDFSKRIGDRLQESATQSQTTLSDLRARLAVIDKAQKNITELSTQVVGLQDILANKQARGAFGEIQLRDIVEKILPPSAYAFQVTLGNGKRVDCLLKLPNPPGSIAIDSKFPLESYEKLCAAREEPAITAARRALAADLRKHVRDIAEKYIVPGETAESAFLFLPSEAVYAEIHANFRGVVEESHQATVWIVSPTTLWAMLTTIRAVLRDVRMREQAGLIQVEVQTLLKDVMRLDDRVGKLQSHFNQASDDVRQIRISTDKITKRGDRIAEVEMQGMEQEPETEAEVEAIGPQLKAVSDD